MPIIYYFHFCARRTLARPRSAPLGPGAGLAHASSRFNRGIVPAGRRALCAGKVGRAGPRASGAEAVYTPTQPGTRSPCTEGFVRSDRPAGLVSAGRAGAGGPLLCSAGSRGPPELGCSKVAERTPEAQLAPALARPDRTCDGVCAAADEPTADDELSPARRVRGG